MDVRKHKKLELEVGSLWISKPSATAPVFMGLFFQRQKEPSFTLSYAETWWLLRVLTEMLWVKMRGLISIQSQRLITIPFHSFGVESVPL